MFIKSARLNFTHVFFDSFSRAGYSEGMRKARSLSSIEFDLRKAIVVFSAWVLSVLFLEHAPILVPLFALCGGGCDGGGADGCDGGSGGSTPFLCTVDPEGQASFENDILFGKPNSLFSSFAAGQQAYESGSLRGDLYAIRNSVQPFAGKISFQVKEIEPEESFIDFLSLEYVRIPKGGRVLVDPSFSRFFVFGEDAISSAEGIRKQSALASSGVGITPRLTRAPGNSDEPPLLLEKGETIRIDAVVENPDAPVFLLLESLYRDWTLGEIPGLVPGKGFSFGSMRSVAPFDARPAGIFPVRLAKTALFFLVFGLIWLLNGIGFGGRGAGETMDGVQARRLLDSYGARSARADVPYSSPYGTPYSTPGGGGWRSIVVSFWNGERYEEIDVVQPRYYQGVQEAVPIPRRAIREDGSVSLQLEATKRHKVAGVSLVSPQREIEFVSESLKLLRAYHRRLGKDYAAVLREERSGEYLHTIPGDVVDIEFSLPSRLEGDDEKGVYVLRAGGFYTPLSETSRREAGDWLSKLDAASLGFLREMSALGTKS